MRLRRPVHARPEDGDWVAHTPVAHRGLHDPAHPENSLAAFEQACALGYAIELDVLLTSDGVPIVFHDDNTARLTGVDKEVASSTIAELKALRLAGTDECIPTFEETARLVEARTPLLVEIKTGPKPAAVCPSVLDSLHAHNVTFAIMSFDPRVLIWLKRHSPATRRLQLAGALRGEPVPPATKLLLRSMLTNVVTGPQGIAYDIASTPSVALSLWRHLLHCDVLFWTVDSPVALDRARRLKGNVIFENSRP